MTRILVVDDEPAIRDFLRMALEDEGYSVATARDGREALDMIRRDPPDAILLDLMMPTMDGAEFLAMRRAVSAGSRCPVLVMSAVDGSHAARELGAAGFLAKPFGVDALLRTLARIVPDG